MKKYIWLVVPIFLIACSTSLIKPTANIGASTGTPIPAPPIVSPPIAATARPETCTVSAGTLNLRTAPEVQGSDVIAWMDKGDVLNLLPDPPAGVWVKVITADNLTGWINSTYCER